MSEAGARYQRSAQGLIGALVVTLALVGGFVLVRALGRDNPTVRPDAVDYREVVALAQADGAEVVYPRSLPRGWIATSVDLEPGSPPDWGLGMLTDEGRFVGLRQERSAVSELLEVYVDERPAEEGRTKLEGPVARSWRIYTDEGGDLAYAAEVGDQTLLVYGSADDADLRRLIARLTTEPQ